MKSRLACDRFHVSKNESLTGKMLVQFSATSLLIMVRNRLARYERQHKSLKDRVYLISISDQNVLLYLNNVMAKKLHEGWLYDEVTGRNKRFYAALGIKPPGSEKTTLKDLRGLKRRSPCTKPKKSLCRLSEIKKGRR